MARRPATIYGLRAALAVGVHRPQAIQRVVYDAARRDALRSLLKVTASQRRPYREGTADDLAALAGTVHHEGVVVVADPLPLLALPALLARLPSNGLVVALDGVDNPHNVGAVLRSAAWFGVDAVLVGEGGGDTLNPATVRVAQGGAEVVPVAAAHLPRALEALRARGYAVLGADQNATIDALTDPPTRPVCLVLGGEAEGLSEDVRAACDVWVRVPGTGAVESLNVGVAAAILMARAFRA